MAKKSSKSKANPPEVEILLDALSVGAWVERQTFRCPDLETAQTVEGLITMRGLEYEQIARANSYWQVTVKHKRPLAATVPFRPLTPSVDVGA